jgi:hypothetical protein
LEENINAQINTAETHAHVQRVENPEKLLVGITAGIVAAMIGAVIWALITFWTRYQIGWMAIGVGGLVGWAMRFIGKGSTIKFGIIGALLALLGCLTGNLLVTCFQAAREYHVSIFRVFSILNMTVISDIFTETFKALDVLFYGLAIYAGFRFSFEKKGKQKMFTPLPGSQIPPYPPLRK